MRSYSYLMSASGNEQAHYVELLENKLMELLRIVVKQIEVDENWYRRAYADVDQAVKTGEFSSGRQHYIEAGFFENRFPRRISVDEEWYLQEYGDVAAAIRQGAFSSSAQHFEKEGFKEGRLPYARWSLIAEPLLEPA